MIFIYSLVDYKPLRYEDYDYPDWADALGWCLALASMIQIPFWAVVQVARQKGTLKEVGDTLANVLAGIHNTRIAARLHVFRPSRRSCSKPLSRTTTGALPTSR